MSTRTTDLPRDFGFGEDHELLRDSARRFLEERCPVGEVRRVAEEAGGFDPALWKEVAELGWTGLVIPEVHGGAGLGALHLALLLEEMGRHLVPVPLLGATLAARAILVAGDAAQQARWLPGLASGELRATLAWLEADGAFEPDELSARAEPDNDGWRLSGTKAFVPGASWAELVVAPFRQADGALALFCIDLSAPGVNVAAEVGVDPTRPTGRIAFEDARVPADARLATSDESACRQVLDWGFTALAAEMVGGAEAALQLTAAYARERIQFGRPIGSFQAVKHPLVDAMIGVESARTLAYAAAAALDHAPAEAEVPARMAKAAAGDAFSFVARKSVQLHGGYGFTWDCDAQLYFKRCLWLRAVLGDAAHHRRHLAGALLGPGE